jgi:hypothetical protein
MEITKNMTSNLKTAFELVVIHSEYLVEPSSVGKYMLMYKQGKILRWQHGLIFCIQQKKIIMIVIINS